MTVTHIFAYRHGQETMTAIFGSEHPPELFSPANAILMYKKAENFFDQDYFVIVPLVSENPSETEVRS